MHYFRDLTQAFWDFVCKLVSCSNKNPVSCPTNELELGDLYGTVISMMESLIHEKDDLTNALKDIKS